MDRRFQFRSAGSFSSACTTNRFPSSRCVSTIQIFRPWDFTAETQPQLQRALLRSSGDDFPVFRLTIKRGDRSARTRGPISENRRIIWPSLVIALRIVLIAGRQMIRP